ncbi:MAG: JAB domain-containing protein [Ruminococcus sp.]|nr:JAB domain-containing protein [Ruminococcus sp.]
MADTFYDRKELSALSDQKLLELLFDCCRISEAESLAADIIARHGDLASAACSDVSSDDNVLALLRLIPALSRSSTGAAPRKASLSDPEKAFSYFRKRLAGAQYERFTAAAADEKLVCSAAMPCISGTRSSVIVSCRQVVSFALSSGCDILFIAHSHPVGGPSPSQDDIDLTASLISILRPLGIILADHIIIAENSAFSMRRSCGKNLFGDDAPEGYRL